MKIAVVKARHLIKEQNASIFNAVKPQGLFSVKSELKNVKLKAGISFTHNSILHIILPRIFFSLTYKDVALGDSPRHIYYSAFFHSFLNVKLFARKVKWSIAFIPCLKQ